jgi:uncharacterized protein YndB with AHSA1/START domain
MPPIVSSFEIDRPPQEVYAYVTDPSRFPEWQRDVVRVDAHGGRAAAVGSRFTTIRRFAGAERATVQEVTELAAPTSWAARGVDGPIRPAARVTVEPVDGGAGSRVTFSLDFEGHGVGRGLLPAVRRQAAKGAPVSYRNLKRRLEGGG